MCNHHFPPGNGQAGRGKNPSPFPMYLAAVLHSANSSYEPLNIMALLRSLNASCVHTQLSRAPFQVLQKSPPCPCCHKQSSFPNGLLQTSPIIKCSVNEDNKISMQLQTTEVYACIQSIILMHLNYNIEAAGDWSKTLAVKYCQILQFLLFVLQTALSSPSWAQPRLLGGCTNNTACAPNILLSKYTRQAKGGLLSCSTDGEWRPGEGLSDLSKVSQKEGGIGSKYRWHQIFLKPNKVWWLKQKPPSLLSSHHELFHKQHDHKYYWSCSCSTNRHQIGRSLLPTLCQALHLQGLRQSQLQEAYNQKDNVETNKWVGVKTRDTNNITYNKEQWWLWMPTAWASWDLNVPTYFWTLAKLHVACHALNPPSQNI